MLDRLTIERMAAKAGEGPILVALSGGGDSVALLHLLLAEFGAPRLRVCVVDHALRDGSAADAERAAGFAEALGLRASMETVDWEGCTNRAHEAAREMRYAALCDVARSVGARVIATGHTRDDQAETVFLRAARGSGLRGLAGMRAMAPVPIWPEGRGLTLARPLLRTRREALRAYLRDQRAEWIEDPSNANVVHARVRARRALAAMERNGLDPMRLASIAEKLAPHADALAAAAFELIQATSRTDAGWIALEPEALAADEVVRQRALFAVVTATGGHPRGPSSDQVAALDAAIAREDFASATLAGALIRKGGGLIRFQRDRSAFVGRSDGTSPIAPLPLEPGEEAVWDRRLAITAHEPGWSVIAARDGVTWLARGEERASVAVASSHWLLMERARHVLGRD